MKEESVIIRFWTVLYHVGTEGTPGLTDPAPPPFTLAVPEASVIARSWLSMSPLQCPDSNAQISGAVSNSWPGPREMPDPDRWERWDRPRLPCPAAMGSCWSPQPWALLCPGLKVDFGSLWHPSCKLIVLLTQRCMLASSHVVRRGCFVRMLQSLHRLWITSPVSVAFLFKSSSYLKHKCIKGRTVEVFLLMAHKYLFLNIQRCSGYPWYELGKHKWKKAIGLAY